MFKNLLKRTHTELIDKDTYEYLYEYQKPVMYKKEPVKIYNMDTVERPDHYLTSVFLSCGDVIYIKEKK